MDEPEHAVDLLTALRELAAKTVAPRGVNWARHVRQRWLANHDSPASLRLDEQLRALGSSFPP